MFMQPYAGNNAKYVQFHSDLREMPADAAPALRNESVVYQGAPHVTHAFRMSEQLLR